MELREILKKYRKQAWLTQNQLADKAGVSRGYYSQIEGGFQTNQSRSVLEAIGRALGVSSLSAVADFSAILPDASIFPAPDVAEDTVAFPVIGDLAAGRPLLTEDKIRAWLLSFRAGDADDPRVQRRMVNTFINAIYLYDDRLVIGFNYTAPGSGDRATLTLAEADALIAQVWRKKPPHLYGAGVLLFITMLR